MNKVILMGRLTKDPEMRHTATGKAVCSFTLAVDRRYGENETDFFVVQAWQKTAEFCEKYFSKGQKVAVVGRLQNRSWEDNNGNKRSVTEVIAEEVFFAEKKQNTGDSIDDISYESELDGLPF